VRSHKLLEWLFLYVLWIVEFNPVALHSVCQGVSLSNSRPSLTEENKKTWHENTQKTRSKNKKNSKAPQHATLSQMFLSEGLHWQSSIYWSTSIIINLKRLCSQCAMLFSLWSCITLTVQLQSASLHESSAERLRPSGTRRPRRYSDKVRDGGR